MSYKAPSIEEVIQTLYELNTYGRMRVRNYHLQPKQQVPLVSCRMESPIREDHFFGDGVWCEVCGTIAPRKR